MSTAHGHGVRKLCLKLVHIGLHAFLSAAVDRGDEGAGDEHRIGTQSQSLEHVHAGADAAVHKDLHLAAHGVHNGRQDLSSGGALIQHTAAVVGDDDTSGTGFQCLFRTLHRHDALEDKGLAGHGGDLLQLVHGFTAGGGIQSL